MIWQRVHEGYYRAESDYTDEEYVVRTRPLNDGWMAIGVGLVIATGKTFNEAKEICERVEKQEREDLMSGARYDA